MNVLDIAKTIGNNNSNLISKLYVLLKKLPKFKKLKKIFLWTSHVMTPAIKAFG